MEFDFKHADNIWHFPRKFILSENSKTNSSFLWVRGFSSPDWWLSLSFEAIPHYQSANLCKESSIHSHNTVKEVRSAAADEEKDKCILSSCVLLKSRQTPSLWLFWAWGGGSCRSVEATWNSGGWRSNQLVCIAMRHHWLCQPAKATNVSCQLLNVTAVLLVPNYWWQWGVTCIIVNLPNWQMWERLFQITDLSITWYFWCWLFLCSTQL